MAVRFFLLEATKHIGGHHHEEQTHENHISNEDVMKERSASVRAADPLSSWAEGPAKSAIVQFVQSVTEKDGKDYAHPRSASLPLITTAPCASNIPCIPSFFSPPIA